MPYAICRCDTAVRLVARQYSDIRESAINPLVHMYSYSYPSQAGEFQENIVIRLRIRSAGYNKKRGEGGERANNT